MSDTDTASFTSIVEKALARERLDNMDRRFVHPPYVLECRLHDHIVAAELEPAFAMLKQINKMERAKLAHDRFRSLKNSLVASCTNFTRAAIDGGVDAELAFTLSDTFIRRIEATRSEEDLEGAEEGMLREFIALVRRYREDHHDVLVARAIKIVKARITKEVTLQETAAALCVSEQHLSSQFSRNMGLSFVDYVQKVKVEEAKYFLRSTDLGVMQIAQMFGFTYQAYFTRVFKKVEGLTPTEYRRRNFMA